MTEQEKIFKTKLRRIFELSLSLLLILTMVILYFIGRTKNMTQPSRFKTEAELELKGKIFLSRFENGTIRLNLKGKNLSYDQDTRTALLWEPEVEIWDAKGMIMVQGKKGIYQQEEERVQIQEDVEVKYQDYQARTSSLDYDLKSEVAESEQDVWIQGRGLDLRGKGFKVDLKKGEVELKSGVSGKIKKVNKAEEKKG